LFPLGHVDEALRRVDQARSRAEATAHVPTLIQLHFWRFFLGAMRRRFDWVAADVRTVSALVAQHNVNTFVGYTTFAEGWMKWALGEGHLGMAEMLKGIRISRDNGYRLCLPFYEAAVAEAEAQAGDIDAALARLERALAEIEETGERWCEAEMHRIRAELLLQRDPTNIALADEALHKAIAIGKAQKARSFELRAALSLGRLYQSTGRPADAYSVLAPALEGFAPTPEFPEIEEAQTLLALLAQ
jgi:predicted ATPase